MAKLGACAPNLSQGHSQGLPVAVVLFRLNWGRICFQAHSVVGGLQFLIPSGLRPSTFPRLLARVHSWFLRIWVPFGAAHKMATCFIKVSRLGEKRSARWKSQCSITWSQKWPPITLAMFYVLETSHYLVSNAWRGYLHKGMKTRRQEPLKAIVEGCLPWLVRPALSLNLSVHKTSPILELVSSSLTSQILSATSSFPFWENIKGLCSFSNDIIPGLSLVREWLLLLIDSGDILLLEVTGDKARLKLRFLFSPDTLQSPTPLPPQCILL